MGQMKRHKLVQLFDLDEARARKEQGMSLAAVGRKQRLTLAREIAATLGRRCGEVDADMVGRILKAQHGIESLGPAAGSIFRGKNWEFTGRRKLSARKTNHAREIKVWRWVK